MYIEDLICKLYISCTVNKFDTILVSSFADQALRCSAFTEKQSNLAVKILKRYNSQLSQVIGADVDPFLENPVYKFPIRKIVNIKRISIVDHTEWKKAIKVECPFDQNKIDQIKKGRTLMDLFSWNSDEKSWLFSLSEKNIQFVSSLSGFDEFELDEEFSNYFEQINQITKNIENYVPMITLENGTPKYVNVAPSMPPLKSTSVIQSVFEARKNGIFTWDDCVYEFLESQGIDPVVKAFLNSEQNCAFVVDSEIHPIRCLGTMIQYMQPCLFVIPGGSELDKTQMVYEFLKELGYKNEEMSVMFRLPSSYGKKFNDFVKDNNLNNPISDVTKFVFISIKLPKPVINSEKKFDHVISLGKSNVHYTIREFLKNRQSLIYYCENSNQKGLTFEYM